jgi:hypothetical protein
VYRGAGGSAPSGSQVGSQRKLGHCQFGKPVNPLARRCFRLTHGRLRGRLVAFPGGVGARGGPEQLIKMAIGNFADAYGMRPARPMATPVLQTTPWTIATERPVPTPRLGSCEARQCRVDSEPVPAVATPATLQSVRQRPPAIALDPRLAPRRHPCAVPSAGPVARVGSAPAARVASTATIAATH